MVPFQASCASSGFSGFDTCFLDFWCCFSMLHSCLLSPTFVYTVPLLLVICNWFYYTVRGSGYRYCLSLRKHSPRSFEQCWSYLWQGSLLKEDWMQFDLWDGDVHINTGSITASACQPSRLPRTRTFCFKKTQGLC